MTVRVTLLEPLTVLLVSLGCGASMIAEGGGGACLTSYAACTHWPGDAQRWTCARMGRATALLSGIALHCARGDYAAWPLKNRRWPGWYAVSLCCV
jgi:uncharacterized protein YceK